jgi:hypothetical protein
MLSVDLYTKVVLSIIAVCLVVISVEQSHWSKLETVQAQQPMLISGYNFDDSGTQKQYRLGNGAGEKPGIPVVVQK